MADKQPLCLNFPLQSTSLKFIFIQRKWTEIKEFIYSEMPKKILAIKKILNTPLEQENNW